MAEHRLARLKHIFRVRFQGSTTIFQPEGLIDITAMTETGHLDRGRHTPDGGSPLTITADAIAGDDNRLFLRFSHNSAAGTFFGELTFDDGTNQVVVGKFSPTTVRAKDQLASESGKTALDQVQEQWVITKP